MAARRSRFVAKPCLSRESGANAVPVLPEGAGQDSSGASAATTDVAPGAAALLEVSRAVGVPDFSCFHKTYAEHFTNPSVIAVNVTGGSYSGNKLGKRSAPNRPIAAVSELAVQQTGQTAPPEPQRGRPKKQTWSPFQLKTSKFGRCSQIPIVNFIYYNPPGEPLSHNATTVSRLGDKGMTQRHERASGEKEPGAEPTFAEKGPRFLVSDNGETSPYLAGPTVRSAESTRRTLLCQTEDFATGYSTFHKEPSKDQYWNAKQTARFYRALSAYGTDFTLMMAAFPNRTRSNLKNKFIQEERQHQKLVDKILIEPKRFDIEGVEGDFAEPNELEHHFPLEGNHRCEAPSAVESPARAVEDESLR